jgi:hypothetical protein
LYPVSVMSNQNPLSIFETEQFRENGITESKAHQKKEAHKQQIETK